MRKTSFLLMLFIFLVSYGYSFVVNPYLFKGEKAAFIEKENIIVDNVNYTLYISNGSWILLVKNDEELIKNGDEIRKIMDKYYEEKYGIGEEESKKIEDLLLIINASRNDGDKFPGYEEDTCKFVLGERYNRPANWESIYDNDIYRFYAVATCSKFASAIGCSNPDDVYPDIRDFFESSNKNDVLMEEMLTLAREMKGVPPLEKLSELEEKLDEFEQNEEVLENSIFRVPIEPGSCDKCFGICPPVYYNKTAISELRNLISELKEKAVPLSQKDEVINALIAETTKRVSYKEGKELNKIYGESVKRLLEKWEEKEIVINRSVSKIRDNELEKNYSKLMNMAKEFNLTLENYNFTNITERMQEFNTILNITYEKAVENLKRYNEVKKIRDKIEAYLYLMENEGYLGVEELRSQKEELDVLFNKKISLNALPEFEKEYRDLLETVERKKNAGSIFSPIGQFIRTVFSPFANGIVRFITAFNINNEGITNNIPLLAGITAGLFLFSIALVFGGIVYTVKPVLFGFALHKSTLKFIYFGVIGFIGIIGIVVGLLSIIPLSKGISNAPLLELVEVMKSSGNVNIIIDKSTLDSFEERKYCARLIQDSFNNLGVNSEIYYKDENDQCISSNESIIESCSLSSVPQIILVSSEKSSFKGSDVGFIRLYIKGNKATFEDCLVASLIE